MSVLFLDRDGVINRFPGIGKYVTSDADFELLPHAAEAIRLLTDAGYEIFVITNQGCISRKMITSQALEAIHDRMKREIEKIGGRIAGIYYCPHQKADNCECKKPKTALYKKALGKKIENFQTIFVIGDSQEDIEAGKTLGCKTILVLSGRTQEKDLPALPFSPDVVKKDLLDATHWLLKKSS